MTRSPATGSTPGEPEALPLIREIGNLLPNNQRQRRTCYALCHILYPVSAALASFFRMDSISTSFNPPLITHSWLGVWCRGTSLIRNRPPP